MQKFLAFDYGKKNIGIAISHNNMALKLKCLNNNEDIFNNIKSIVEREKVTKFIVGMPLKEDGSDSEQSIYTKKFIELLEKNTSIPVIIIEESLTTKIAIKNLQKLGFNKDQIKKEKDSEAARIMLQEYLDNL